MRITLKSMLITIGILVVLSAIPLTLFLLQQQQQTTSNAQKATTLSFSTPTTAVTVGQNFKVSVLLTPNSNQVSFVKLVLLYDNTKFKRVDPTITDFKNTFPVTLEDPKYDTACNANICNMTVTMSIQPGGGGAISTTPPTGSSPIPIATINLQALAPAADTTTGSNAVCSGLCIDQSKTQVLSVASGDQPAQNVLASATDATLTVTTVPTGTPAPTIPPSTTDTTGTGGTSGTSGGTTGSTTAPICSSFAADKTTITTGSSVNFTAQGSSSTSTIAKVTFAFGDGATQDVNSGGGIGTGTVSATLSHTYSNAGTFSASAYIRDAAGNTSNITSCSTTITVSANTPTPTPIPASGGKLPGAGPSPILFGIGIAGLLAVIGGAMLFIL